MGLLHLFGEGDDSGVFGHGGAFADRPVETGGRRGPGGPSGPFLHGGLEGPQADLGRAQVAHFVDLEDGINVFLLPEDLLHLIGGDGRSRRS